MIKSVQPLGSRLSKFFCPSLGLEDFSKKYHLLRSTYAKKSNFISIVIELLISPHLIFLQYINFVFDCIHILLRRRLRTRFKSWLPSGALLGKYPRSAIYTVVAAPRNIKYRALHLDPSFLYIIYSAASAPWRSAHRARLERHIQLASTSHCERLVWPSHKRLLKHSPAWADEDAYASTILQFILHNNCPYWNLS